MQTDLDIPICRCGIKAGIDSSCESAGNSEVKYIIFVKIIYFLQNHTRYKDSGVLRKISFAVVYINRSIHYSTCLYKTYP